MCKTEYVTRLSATIGRDLGFTVIAEDGSYIVLSRQEGQWSLHKDRGRFILEYDPSVQVLEKYLHTMILNYPLVAYEKAYRSRGCEPRSSIVSLLTRIRSNTVSEENLPTIMAWILQLSYELNQNKEDQTFRDMYELGEELDRLLELTIKKYRQL